LIRLYNKSLPWDDFNSNCPAKNTESHSTSHRSWQWKSRAFMARGCCYRGFIHFFFTINWICRELGALHIFKNEQ